MEDRYLFKAKRLDNGEWVTGNLIQNPFFKGVRSWISSEQEDKTRLRSISGTKALWNSIEVDSSTICQCTGLKDKSGTLIWENDIVEKEFYTDYDAFANSERYVGTIKWTDCAAWEVVTDRCNILIAHELEFTDWKDHCKVIGNIFDNPELLLEE